MVAVGMLHTCEHFAYDYSAQTSADGFDLLDTAGLKSGRGQCCRNFVRCEVKIDVFFKPIVGNIHKRMLFQSAKVQI